VNTIGKFYPDCQRATGLLNTKKRAIDLIVSSKADFKSEFLRSLLKDIHLQPFFDPSQLQIIHGQDIKNGHRGAGVAKLADASDLGSDAARHGGSSPSIRTKGKIMQQIFPFDFFLSF
jgi:hypothetical protein